MQLLWTSKSQVLRLEESSLYGNKTDEVSMLFKNWYIHSIVYNQHNLFLVAFTLVYKYVFIYEQVHVWMYACVPYNISPFLPSALTDG